jgi:DNA-binding transcriptional LysR family regulator
MSIGRIDLNLIRVFDAVYEDRNLLRAGKRLHLSQSAVSHALARLREVVGDELFVRTAKGMMPTARATTMADDLRSSLRRIDLALGVEPFIPGQSTRCFVIAANDHLTTVLVAELNRLMAKEAPGIDLVVRPSTRLDLAEQVDVGRIDLALGIFAQIPSRLSARTLMTQGELIVMRKRHPSSRRKLVLQDLSRYPLVTVSVGGLEEGAVGGFILERGLARQAEMFDRQALEEALSRIGLAPRYRTTVPHSLAIPALLRDSDMLSIMPSSLARSLAAGGELLMREPPYASELSTFRAVWHSRNDHDPAHLWLRESVARAAQQVA